MAMASPSDVDLRLLRVFEKVVKHQSYVGAQVEMNVSQAAVSTQMSALETRLGVRLCQRGRGGFRLTEDGEKVFAAASRLLGSVETFRTEIDELHGKLSGTLRIGIIDNTITNKKVPLHEVFRHFDRRDHDVFFDLSIGSPPELEIAVLEGRVHLAVGDFPRKISTLDFRPAYTEEHRLYCGRDHVLFGKDDDGISEDDIVDCKVAGRAYTNGMDLRRAGVERPSAIVSSVECMAFMILSGRYIGFLPNHFAQQWVEMGQLRAVKPERYHYSSPFHVATRKGTPLNLVTDAFIGDLRSVFGSQDT